MEQALADFALAIDHIKQTEGVSVGGAKSSPVVGFGGSYGGMLCAWMRMKYPHKIIGLVKLMRYIKYNEVLYIVHSIYNAFVMAYMIYIIII